MEPAEIDGIKENERGFRTDGDLLVAVSVKKSRQDSGDLALKVRGRVVDESGQTVELGGESCVAPAKVTAVSAVGLADGRITVREALATATTEAVERAKKHHAALKAWDDLPLPEEAD